MAQIMGYIGTAIGEYSVFLLGGLVLGMAKALITQIRKINDFSNSTEVRGGK